MAALRGVSFGISGRFQHLRSETRRTQTGWRRDSPLKLDFNHMYFNVFFQNCGVCSLILSHNLEWNSTDTATAVEFEADICSQLCKLGSEAEPGIEACHRARRMRAHFRPIPAVHSVFVVRRCDLTERTFTSDARSQQGWMGTAQTRTAVAHLGRYRAQWSATGH